MTLTPPLAATTMAALAAAVAALIVVAYILKLRRRRFEVPFSKLWQRVLHERETTTLWRRLRRLLSLLLQLAVAGLLLGAALDPRVGSARTSGRSVVLLIDASASMKALDLGPDRPPRIERAKDRARRIVRGLGGGDAAMVVAMDGQATALSRFESDPAHLLTAVDRVEASDTAADLRRALGAAADALRGRREPMIVVIGDGDYPGDQRDAVVWDPAAQPELGQVDLRGVDVRFVPVGKSGRNVGVTAFNVRRYLANKLSYEALVEVQNFGAAPEQVKLTLWSGNDPVSVKTLALAPGEARREIWPDLGGGADRALKATVEPAEGADAFPLDDTAYALLPEHKRLRVLLVSEDNMYLEGALLVDDNVLVDKLAPADYEREAATLPAYDAIVYNGFAPEGPPPAPAAIYFGVPAERSPFAVRRTLAQPVITQVARDHPITRWITLSSDVNIDRSLVFALEPGDTAVASCARDPLVAAGKRDGKKLLAFGFSLDGTDLALRVAFPVMLVNALDWFAGDDAELITTYRTGHTWSIPIADQDEGQIRVDGPRGELAAPVAHGRVRFYGRWVGFYKVKVGRTLGLAANLADPFESNIEPAGKLVLAGRAAGPEPEFTPSVSRTIWLYLVLAALALLLVEWLTYHRRITV